MFCSLCSSRTRTYRLGNNANLVERVGTALNRPPGQFQLLEEINASFATDRIDNQELIVVCQPLAGVAPTVTLSGV